VHVYGVAYKRDVGDVRESPALDIITLLARRGAIISYSDPYVPHLEEGAHSFTTVSEAEALRSGVDCVVIVTDHSAFDWNLLVNSGVPIVDTRNALRAFSAPNIVRLSGRVTTRTTDV
jgi:UDP-N-acetyl-D-glucosamine dehydrogenase